MKRFKLSNSEEILMDTLWRENRPLTTLQLAEKVTEASWNTNYIDKLLGQLVKKGMVQVSGLLQGGNGGAAVICAARGRSDQTHAGIFKQMFILSQPVRAAAQGGHQPTTRAI